MRVFRVARRPRDAARRVGAPQSRGDPRASVGERRCRREFERLVDDLLHERDVEGPSAPRDLTEFLLRERIDGQPIDRAALASVLRNCTMGEVGTIAASVGIIARFLADQPDEQERLRRDPTGLPAAIDEILRLHGPLVDTRRTATGPTTIGGRRIERGDRVVVNWVAANRDPQVFADADRYRPDRDATDNLLYGAGIHVCPGAPLARLELRVMIEVLLAVTASMTLVRDRPARPAVYPAGGYASVVLEVTAADAMTRGNVATASPSRPIAIEARWRGDRVTLWRR